MVRLTRLFFEILIWCLRRRQLDRKSTENRMKIDENSTKIHEKSVRGAFGTILDDSGRLWHGTRALWRRSGTLSGRSREASGRSWDALGTLWDAPGTPSGRLGTAFLRNSLADPFGRRLGVVFSMIFCDFPIVLRTVCRSLFARFFDVFSIGYRSLFCSKASSHLERPIIVEHRFLCAWPVFRSVFFKTAHR